MKEININIEGYNVNGICVGCLNYNRPMFYHSDIKECFRLLGNIDVPDGLEIQVCWECLAYVRSALRFRRQILNSFDFLMTYSNQHTFLDSPNDFISRASSRLSVTKLETCVCLPKEEPLDVEVATEKGLKDVIKEENYYPESDIKSEILDESIFSDVALDAGNTSEEDVQLSLLKVKESGRKKKRIKEDKVEIEIEPTAVPTDNIKIEEKKRSRKMKNLSEDLVELFTMTNEEMRAVRKDDLNSIEFLKIRNRCDHCIIGFNTERKRQEHFKGKHMPKGPDCYLCTICNSYLSTKDNVASHSANHLLGFRCRRCGFVSALKRRAISHQAQHESQTNVCQHCNTGFSTKSKLIYHRAICQQERPQCDCCGKVFANKMTLKFHLKSILKSNQPEETEKKKKDRVLIQCKHCKKLYRSKKSYRSHVVIHDGVSYPCDICGKLFQWKRNLARHLRNHREKESGARHECRECGKTFASRECLNQHMTLSKRHVAEDNFQHECNYCGKKYATKWCLTDHIDWDHLKLIKYQCTICFKAFKTSKIMVAHVNNVHEGKKREADGRHLCEICGKEYKTVKRLKSHMSVTHMKRMTGKNYKCKLCAATFTWPTSIYKHMKMMHSSQSKSPRRVKKEDQYKESHNLARVQYYQQNVGGNLRLVSIQPEHMEVAQEITYP
ncbi:zinc finger protein 57-like isoform X2 [Trichoplusia ni]|uniref:Zinc finger protein 57-like isoform X2 n=1 Tax=Trichoplusia ni TaxID=7111 RepID=A0A7E5X3U6_TRINI|nr:zinc finger protein 57-like isoform X2 [Trichoplusia ni]